MSDGEHPPGVLPFRLYLAHLPNLGHDRVVFLYWDSSVSGRALIDPFFYEHFARGDIEARILICRFWDASVEADRYSWGFRYDDQAPEPDKRRPIYDFAEEYEADFTGLLEQSFERALRCASEPFRSLLAR